MTITQFFLILRARWLLILLTFAFVVGTTLAVSVLLPKQYTAKSAVVVDIKSPDAVTGAMMQGGMAPGYMATQVDIIRSERVSKAVVSQLKLESDPTAGIEWPGGVRDVPASPEGIAANLRKALSVAPSRDSNVLQIEFTGKDPEVAATVANAFTRAYIDVNLELRVSPAREFAKFFEGQTQSARERLEAARKALTDYQQANGITAEGDSLDFETARLNDISGQLTQIQGQTTDSRSKRERGGSDTVAEVIQNPVINGLKADIARLQAKLNESSANLGRNHPQIISMTSELQALRDQLTAETRKITSSIDTTYQVSREREGQLRASLAAQKERVLNLNKQRDQIQLLRSELLSAQRQFETVSARASQTNVESQTSQTNISVLNVATPPGDPSKPKLLLNLLVSLFMGGLLGVGLALVLELLSRRVRSSEDLTDLPGVPLLGQLSSAKRAIKLAGAGASA
jgi:polysaccharide biosynthesis transport protein